MLTIGDRYNLLKSIGEGGNGVVYRATDRKIQRQVAVKKLSTGLDPKALEKIEREVLSMGKVGDKRHVVEIFDFVEHEEFYYLVMEFIDGGRTLGDEVGTDAAGAMGSLSVPQALRYFRQACDGLKAVHDANLVHGDIKLRNLFLTKAGVVKLGDFGNSISSNLSRSLPTGRSGTAKTMAPEVFSGQQWSKASDIYALGFSFYELFMGERGFAEQFKGQVEAGDAAFWLWQRWHIDTSEIAPPLHEVVPTVPTDLSELIAEMIEKDPARRPTIESILSRDLLAKDVIELAIQQEPPTIVAPPDQEARVHDERIMSRHRARRQPAPTDAPPPPSPTAPAPAPMAQGRGDDTAEIPVARWRRRALYIAGGFVSTAVVLSLIVFFFVLDRTPPVLEMISPPDLEFVTQERRCDIEFRVTDESSLNYVEVWREDGGDGEKVFPSDDSSGVAIDHPRMSVNLASGRNEFRIYYADGKNAEERELIVFRDDVPPGISMDDHVTETEETTVTLGGTVTDNIGLARVEIVDGRSRKVSGKKASFTLEAALTKAVNPIEVRVTDRSGRTATWTTTILCTANAPKTGGIEIQNLRPYAVVASVGGKSVTVGPRSIESVADLQPGEHDVTFTADAAVDVPSQVVDVYAGGTSQLVVSGLMRLRISQPAFMPGEDTVWVVASIGQPDEASRDRPARLATCVAIDTSGDTGDRPEEGLPSFLTVGKRAARGAINKLGDDDQVTFIPFNTRPSASEKARADGRTRTRIVDQINNLRARGQTNIGRALREAGSLLSDSSELRHLILISDGDETGGTSKEELVGIVRQMANEGLTVDTYAMSPKPELQSLLWEMSLAGGRFFDLSSAPDRAEDVAARSVESIRYCQARNVSFSFRPAAGVQILFGESLVSPHIGVLRSGEVIHYVMRLRVPSGNDLGEVELRFAPRHGGEEVHRVSLRLDRVSEANNSAAAGDVRANDRSRVGHALLEILGSHYLPRAITDAHREEKTEVDGHMRKWLDPVRGLLSRAEISNPGFEATVEKIATRWEQLMRSPFLEWRHVRSFLKEELPRLLGK